MKKILFVISQLYKGGAETSLVNLLNRLDYKQYSVELLILNQAPAKNTVSLIEKVNKNVTICDAYAEYKEINVLDRVRAKLLYTMSQKGAYYFTALDFIRNKYYDWAFFVGEWSSPSFVAYEVQAKKKAAWIHTDLSEASYFDADHYFYFADMFDYFIFVSKKSLEASVRAYPFLRDKAVTIYNISDVEDIRKKANESVDDLGDIKSPIVLTCANIRPEKNHLRQIQAMIQLKERGLNFTWINIGSTTDKKLVSQLETLIDENGLKNNFKILGPRENPYKYMKKADLVAVLSDFESWSMVISEAKILGIPVIATRTSGAVEQIVDGKNGIITDFNATDIADKIECFFNDLNLQKAFRDSLSDFDNTSDILKSFDSLIENEGVSRFSADALYIIDNINYNGGAHIATKLQIKDFINNGKKIAIYSSEVPNLEVRRELKNAVFLSFKHFKEDSLFNKRFVYALLDKSLNKKEKKRKLEYSAKSYLKRFDYNKDIIPHLTDLFSNYDTICVMSEGSVYRKAVAESECKNKIQWIHTDYCAWREKNEWTKKLTEGDKAIYGKFNTIVVLTDNIRRKFIDLYPELEEKVVVNRNLLPIDDIKEKSSPMQYKNEIPLNFITIGRIDRFKAFSRLMEILLELKCEGFQFTWTIVGDGEEYDIIHSKIEKSRLKENVTMTGALDNPFIELKKADIFALLSEYEGLPNTIYEAFILGIPVLATDVGGISTQVNDGVNGWLVENNKKDIKNKIKFLLTHREEFLTVSENLKGYTYDNDIVRLTNEKIFKF